MANKAINQRLLRARNLQTAARFSGRLWRRSDIFTSISGLFSLLIAGAVFPINHVVSKRKYQANRFDSTNPAARRYSKADREMVQEVIP